MVSPDDRGIVREGRGADEVLNRPWSGVGLWLLSDPEVGWGVEDRELVLCKDRRELEVVGRGMGGVNCEAPGDTLVSDVDEVVEERLLLSPSTSTSGVLRGASRGLGATEGVSLATRLCA